MLAPVKMRNSAALFGLATAAFTTMAVIGYFSRSASIAVGAVVLGVVLLRLIVLRR